MTAFELRIERIDRFLAALIRNLVTFGFGLAGMLVAILVWSVS